MNETIHKAIILAHKDSTCEIAWRAHDGNVCITKLPPDVYRSVKEQGYVDEVVIKRCRGERKC
jgi:hypothetical protein